MAETSALAELVNVIVPQWCANLEKYIKEPEQPVGVIITPPGIPEEGVSSGPTVHDSGSSTRRILPGRDESEGGGGIAVGGGEFSIKKKAAETAARAQQLKNIFSAPHGPCRLDAKPDTSKVRFSYLTSPTVAYDGESQRMLCEFWTAVNNNRGGLRRNMMALKRRQQCAQLSALPIEAESDGEENSGKEDSDDMEHSSEILKLRLKMEVERMKGMNRRVGGINAGGTPSLSSIPFKRARMMGGAGMPGSALAGTTTATATGRDDDEKLKALLESIDDELDKACKATETVAFIWLKGDPYGEHLKFIISRLRAAQSKITSSGFAPCQKPDVKSASAGDTKIMPPPPATLTTSPRLDLTRKKSDATMRDACAVSVAPSVGPEQAPGSPIPPHIENASSGSSSGHSLPTPRHLSPSSRIHALGKSTPDSLIIKIETDNDDEGIVC